MVYIKAPILIITLIFMSGCFSPDQDRSRDFERAHNITCKIAYIAQNNVSGKITKKMEQYLCSNNYENVVDKTGRDLLKKTFDSANEMLAARKAKKYFESGRLQAKTMRDAIIVCSHFGFAECSEFEGQGSAEASLVFRAMTDLAECGKDLWQE